MKKAIALALMISLFCVNPSYGLSLKMRGKISMILILSLIGAVDVYLNHRDATALERSCEALDLGELRSIRRYRHGLDLIEVRTYERGVVTVKDGMIWRVERFTPEASCRSSYGLCRVSAPPLSYLPLPSSGFRV